MKFREVPTRRAVLGVGAVGLAAMVAGDGGRHLASRAARTPDNDNDIRHEAYRARPGFTPEPPEPSEPPAPLAPIRPWPRPAHHVREVLPQAPANAVALTIDDGPSPQWTPEMLDILAANEVIATFCLIGIQVKQYPKLAERIAAAGHSLCNHTMNHPLYIARMPPPRIADEIHDAHKRIADATGIAPALFRSPGGSWSRPILDAAAQAGMVPIDWDNDPRDWSRPGVPHIAATMLAAQGGDILLCHDSGGDRSETIEAVRQVIPRLKRRGLSFVALGD